MLGKKIVIVISMSLFSLMSISPKMILAEEIFNYNSKANIIFEINDNGEIEIVDPENPDPEKPIKPVDPEIDPGTRGPLSIDYVSNFHFGTQAINGNGAVYYAELPEVVTNSNEKKKVPNFLQVTDNRGNGEGWSLTVKQDGQFKTTGGAVLKGAELSLHNSVLSSVSSKRYPTIYENMKLNPNGLDSTPILMAEKNHGMGTWSNRFGSGEEEGLKSVQLSLPRETIISASEIYQTSLIWQLIDAP